MATTAVNACGPVTNGRETSYGNPVVLSYCPLGESVAESPDGASDETVVIADLDHELLVERRSQGAFHPRFRRRELHRSLGKGDIGPQNPR